MALQSYFPTAEADRLVWLSNYRAKITTHGHALGLTDQEIADSQADIDRYLWLVQTWHPAAQQFVQAATAHKNQIATGEGSPPLPVFATLTNPPPARPAGVLTRLFAQIARIKTHPGYTETLGRDLGLIATGNNAEHPYPDFTAAAEAGRTHEVVQINFTKYGHDGVWIESRRGGGNWEFLAIDTVKPYIDERPLLSSGTAETREYRMRWWDKGEANGEWSPVVGVAVGA
jgi:hypothetical protein